MLRGRNFSSGAKTDWVHCKKWGNHLEVLRLVGVRERSPEVFLETMCTMRGSGMERQIWRSGSCGRNGNGAFPTIDSTLLSSMTEYKSYFRHNQNGRLVDDWY